MQLEFFEVPSPCIGVCQSDEKGNCLGCLRSRNERQDWISLNNDEKQKVIKRCIQRKKRKDKQGKTDSQAAIPAVEEANKQPSLLDPPSKINVQSKSELDFSGFDL